ncbi:unnamed protein product [Prorocentrum cordatum]|uniref:C3H1-type domain-containing protein n=1 Tax=Prorocentrum cordatum TaxID=2364126 RepID=A0ABN9SXV7_9DINO|nr:unnamed protein product [Polarella glacialis]
MAAFLALHARGALVCLVSRNEEADVRAVLEGRREELALREEHVVAVSANWRDKSANLRDLAARLCLSLGSFAFVDDSPAECAEVAAAASADGAAVVQVPREPAAIPGFLRHAWALDLGPAAGAGCGGHRRGRREDEAVQGAVREEALCRGSGARLVRRRVLVCVPGVPEPDRGRHRAAGGRDRGEGRSLTERTNQHNACRTTASAASLLRLASSGCSVLTVRAADRFGSHGLIGLVVLSPVPGSYVSPNLGIEFTMLRHVAEAARAAGASKLAVHWVRAERNEPAAAFLFSAPGARFVPADPGRLGLRLGDRHAGSSSEPARAPPHELGAGAPRRSDAEQAAAREAARAAAAAAASAAAGQEGAAAAAAAAAAALEASVNALCDAGAEVDIESLPPQTSLAALPAPERRRLASWACGRVSRARRGALCAAAARAAGVAVLRGWVGRDVCRHHATGRGCSVARCPFVHPAGAPQDAPSPSALAPTREDVDRDAELQAERTFGDVARYERSVRDRPASGFVVIDVDVASVLQVRFGDCAGAAEDGSFCLHPDTYFELATALSLHPGQLHAWVATECQRSLVPRPYAEAWELAIMREAEWSRLAEAPDVEGGDVADVPAADLARVRRHIRHAQHLIMQQSNPDSYYAGIDHIYS